MKRIFILICIALPFLTGFEGAENLEVLDIELTIIKSEGSLRYDFLLENTGDKPIESDFDYPGQHPFGIEFVVRPNDELATLMEMEPNTKYKKMQPMGSGSRGYFEPGEEAPFHVSYKIKDDVNFEQVKKQALNSTLLILDGVTVSAEYPLDEYKDMLK
ncbi:hypothetical protein [Oceanobacillus bengalensis]|uniref:Uncharacterized protein n=1 Tax=Oceanobacillus bengalensis TaxID=1435466 RepID=A0A494YXT3_9BACI|nr:hypothetical protein [Oceanobacillus bengalensis]RKQ15023.1 hypothetical protein D8M05_11230 [Oceanobacillus bengalensis]